MVETLKLILRTAEPSDALLDAVRGRRPVETLELVVGATEPANAGGDHRRVHALHTLKTRELVARSAEPTRALLDVGVLSRDAQTLELVVRPAEPTGAALNHAHGSASLVHRRDALALPVAGEPAPTLIDGDDVLRLMIAWVRLIGVRIVRRHVDDVRRPLVGSMRLWRLRVRRLCTTLTALTALRAWVRL